jgi:hypothetical protein
LGGKEGTILNLSVSDALSKKEKKSFSSPVDASPDKVAGHS